MPVTYLPAASASAPGLAEFSTWYELVAALPAPDDGARALVSGVLHVARAGWWLPWDLPGTTRDAARSWGLGDSLAQITARGAWTVNDPAAVSKSAGETLRITGSGVGIALTCTNPAGDNTWLFHSFQGLGVGAGTAAKAWLYRGKGGYMIETLLANATDHVIQWRNPSNGALYGRPVAMTGQVFAIAQVTTPAGLVCRIWSPDDTHGASRYALDAYPSGLNESRIYRSVAGVADTRALLEVLT
jgi:hypothetical protein